MVEYSGSKTAQFSTQNMSQIKKKNKTILAKCLKLLPNNYCVTD